MDWKKVTINTTEEGLDLVGYKLSEIGITQYELVEDAASTQKILDETSAYWDYVDAEAVLAARQPCVRVYLTENAVGEEQLSALRAAVEELKGADGLDLGSLSIEVERVRDEDWANNWKRFYKPMEIGRRLLVKPSWEELEAPTDRIVLQMDPGMVFGTGTHETTQLCLEMLDAQVQPGMRVLDLGCGSGILSIGALLLGAKSAVGVDIDPNAVDIAYTNAAMNGIGKDVYTVLSGDILNDKELERTFTDKKYDVVEANIVADVIIALSPRVPSLLKDGGVFIASGIIKQRQEDVLKALFENGFDIIDIGEEKDWTAVAARYKG